MGTMSVWKFVPVYQVDADLFNKWSANFDLSIWVVHKAAETYTSS